MRALIQGINPLRMGVVLCPKKGRKGVPISLLHGLWIRKRLEKCQGNRAGDIAKQPDSLGGILLETGGNLVTQARLVIDQLAQVQAQTIKEPIVLVDSNQLCDLGHAAQIVLFYRGLAAIAQSEQRLDIRDLPDSVNA